MRSKIVLASAVSFLFMGCSALMPYHEEFICQGGSNVNICKRVSDIYLESDKLIDKNKTTSTVEVKNNNSCKSNEDCKELKEIVEAISYSELKNTVEVKIIKECRKPKLDEIAKYSFGECKEGR